MLGNIISKSACDSKNGETFAIATFPPYRPSLWSVTYGRFKGGALRALASEGRESFNLFLTDALYYNTVSNVHDFDVIRGTEKGKTDRSIIEKYDHRRWA